MLGNETPADAKQQNEKRTRAGERAAARKSTGPQTAVLVVFASFLWRAKSPGACFGMSSSFCRSMLELLLAALAAVCVGGCLRCRKKGDQDVLDWFSARAPNDLTLLVLQYYLPPSLVVVPSRGPVTLYHHLTWPTEQLPSLNPSPGCTVLVSRDSLYCIGAKCARLGLFSRELQYLSPAPAHVLSCPHSSGRQVARPDVGADALADKLSCGL